LRELKDDQLLARFFQAREDAAFGVLLERYGPLVYGICQRILGDAAEAEDAFQATFLVLVRKGNTLRQPGRLANWLYGVAYRTARKLRAKAALRTKTERQASDMPTRNPVEDMTYDELRGVLDEEISKLPEKYSLPLVLCYLEGKTNAEAAAQLGWPEGSMSRRLSRARELLRSRLAKRGMALTAALIAAVFSRSATAAVPPDLLASTVHAATLVSQGVEVEEVVSPATAKLVNDVLIATSAASKFTIPGIVLVATLLISGAAIIWEVGPPAYGATVSLFHRSSSPHALTGSASNNGTASVQGAGTCCGCASAGMTPTESPPAPAPTQ
jgi:RNA polymerase sigma factor (sigma-70 family)